eukprot:GFUD01029451.1.p1 GENE.GFUD01029451.1~~GFUD01029451.1.p1  ORF type:complete len:343 (-),score=51.81 GFUD01029451.1:15-1043(-)
MRSLMSVRQKNNVSEGDIDKETSVVEDEFDAINDDDGDECIWCQKCSSKFESKVFDIHVCETDFKVVISNSKETSEIIEGKLPEHAQKSWKKEGIKEKKACKNDSSADRFKCYLCEKSYTSRQSLRMHVETVHMMKCSRCEKSFTSRQDVRKHINTVHRVECSICEKSYTLRRNLRTHVKTVHNTSQIEIPSCSKSDTTLNKSKVTNRGRFLCQVCGKQLTSECSLQHHIEGIQSGNMLTHVKTVHDNDTVSNRYKCSMCDKSYMHRQSLKKHVIIVHNTSLKEISTCIKSDPTFNKYQCTMCDKSYTRGPSLRVHDITVNNTKLLSTRNKIRKNHHSRETL